MQKWLLFLWLGVGLKATAQSYRIDRIGTDRGLSQGSIYAMLKDSRGFMWFGTQDGLNRYDGHSFKVYYSEPSQAGALHGGFVNSIIESPNGDLWIGTDYGLNWYRRHKDNFSFIEASPAVLSPCTPFASNEQYVWYWSEKEGIVQLDYLQQTKKVILSSLTNRIGLLTPTNATHFGRDAKLWVCLPEGIMSYDTLTKQSAYYFSKHPQNRLGKSKRFYCVLHARNGLIYMGHSEGITVLDALRQSFHEISHFNNTPLVEIYDLKEGSNGVVWVATGGQGVLRYEANHTWTQLVHQNNDANSLSNNTITSIYVADNGIVWANPDPLGVNAIIEQGHKFNKVRYVAEATQSLNDPNVRSLLSYDKNLLWVGTEQGGINVWEKSTKQMIDYWLPDPQNVYALPSQSINQFLRDSEGQIWIATYHGLAHYLGKGRFESFFPQQKQALGNNIIRSIAEWKDQKLLVGTEYGLYEFDKKKRVFTEVEGWQKQNVLWLNTSQKDSIWLTVFNEGCVKGSLQNGRWITYERITHSGNVLSRCQDRARKCDWLATSNGLVQYQNGKIKATYTFKDGLPNSYVYAVLIDKQNNLWLSTNRGLASFNPEMRQFRNYTLADGLQGYEFNNKSYLVDEEGYFYFGGTSGFNYFKPEEVRISTFQPQVQFTNFWINERLSPINQYIGEMDTVRLSFEQNTFSFQFTALDFFSNGQNLYQYRLKNLENNWITTSNTFIRYVKVPAGEYVLEVKAANSDGFWSDDIRQLYVVIRPPFWQTWWFRILVLLGIVIGGIGAYQWRIQSLKWRQRERLNLIIQTQEAERKQLATELHDDLGMRLSTLQMYVSELENTHSGRGHALKPMVEEAIGGIRQQLQDLNPKMLFERGFREAVEDLVNKINVTDTLKFELFWLDFPDRLPQAFEINLFRVIQELVNNTLKHAHASGIELQLLAREQQLIIVYEDNGRGFVPKPFTSGFGLENIRNRIQLLKGNIEFDSRPQHGMCVTIALPHPKYSKL